jgi:excisionase family DNA binding protein
MKLCEDRLLSLKTVLGDYLPVGKTTLFALIKNDKLKVIKLGRRTFIRHSTVQAYIDSLENAA